MSFECAPAHPDSASQQGLELLGATRPRWATMGQAPRPGTAVQLSDAPLRATRSCGMVRAWACTVDPSRHQAAIFAVERGAGWLWLTSLDEQFRNKLVVIAPQAEETEALLGARIARRWLELRRSGTRIGIAGLACSDSHPEPSLLSRASRARRLVAALAADGGGQLVLTAESPALRHTLIAIAGVLVGSLAGAAVQIRVAIPGAVDETTSAATFEQGASA